MKQCPRCKKKLHDESSFCFVCGALEVGKLEKEQQKEEKVVCFQPIEADINASEFLKNSLVVNLFTDGSIKEITPDSAKELKWLLNRTKITQGKLGKTLLERWDRFYQDHLVQSLQERPITSEKIRTEIDKNKKKYEGFLKVHNEKEKEVIKKIQSCKTGISEVKIAKATDIQLPLLRILTRKLVEERKIRKKGELYFSIKVEEKVKEQKIKAWEEEHNGKASVSAQKTETEKIRPKEVTAIGWSATILFFGAGLFVSGKFTAIFVILPLLSFLLFGFLKGKNWTRLLLIGICLINFWWILPLFLVYFCDRPTVRKYFGAERMSIKITFTNIIRALLSILLFFIGGCGILLLTVSLIRESLSGAIILSIVFTPLIILFFKIGEKLGRSAQS